MLTFTFSGTIVLLGLLALCLLTAVGAWYVRRRLFATGSDRTATDPLGLAPAVHRYSLCFSLLTVLLLFNWTATADAEIHGAPAGPIEELFDDIPVTVHQKPTPPPPPPPPPAVIDPVPELVEEAPVFEDPAMVEEAPPAPTGPPPALRPAAIPPPPPVTPPPPPEDAGPLIFAERMPVFGSACADLNGDDRKACSDRALLRFVQQRVRYPERARSNRIEGTVFVRFVVEKDGSVSGVEALREVAGGCTEEALRAIRAINDSGERFTPGIQAGRPVRVIFNLPVKFELN